MARRPPKIPEPSEITDKTPLRLDVAAAIMFPDGTIVASTLRKERDRGTLAVSLIGGKEYTTLADMKTMLELCRRTPKERTVAAGLACGSSETDRLSAAQASALRTAERLRRQLSRPSPKNDGRAGVRLAKRGGPA